MKEKDLNFRFFALNLFLICLLFRLGPASGQADEVAGITLREAALLSLKNNLEIQISALSPDQSEARATEALGRFDFKADASARLLSSSTPSVSSLDGVIGSSLRETKGTFSAGLTKAFLWGPELEFDYDLGISTSNSSNNNLKVPHTTNISLSLAIPVLKTFAPEYFRRDLTAAELDWEIAKAKHGETVISTLSRTLTLYLDTVREQEELKLKQTTYDQARENLEATEAKRRAGRASLLDLNEARSAYQQSYEILINTRYSLENRKQQLALQVFADPSVPVVLAEGLNSEPALELNQGLEEMIEEAVPRRMEWIQARESVTKAKVATSAAELDLQPDITFEPNLKLSGLDRDFPRSHQEVITFNYPTFGAEILAEQTFHRYAAKGAYLEQSLKLQQEQLKELQTRKDIALEIRKNLRQIETVKERIEALGKVVKAETEKYKAESLRFRSGLISTYDLNRALKERLSAQLELLKARIDYRKARYQLAEARGLLLEDLALKP